MYPEPDFKVPFKSWMIAELVDGREHQLSEQKQFDR